MGSDYLYNVSVTNVVDNSMTIYTASDVVYTMIESNREFVLVLKKTMQQDASQ